MRDKASNTNDDSNNNANQPTNNTTSPDASNQKSGSASAPTIGGKDDVPPASKKSDSEENQNAAINTITKQMTAISNNSDVSGSTYKALQLKSTKASKTSITVKWKSVAKASKYLVYGAKNGKKYVLLTTTTSKSFTNKKLKKGTYYKYIVVAVDQNGKKLSTSKVILATTAGGKTNNPTSIKVNKTKTTLKKNKTFKINAKANGKKLKTYKKLSYESSNPKVATVSKSGKVTAKKKGTAYIYVYAQNGVNKKIKVTVK